MGKLIAALVVLLITIGIAVGGWFFYRWVHWELIYEDNARALVCEMVKPDALREPCEEE